MIKGHIIDDYLDYMKSTKGSSDNTIKEYYYDLRTFFRFLMIRFNLTKEDELDKIEIDNIGIETLEKVSKQDLYAYNAFLERRLKNSNKTKHRKMSSVRSFYAYLTNKVELIKNNPAENLDMPKVKSSLPVYLSLEEAINLLKTVETSDQNPLFKQRDYAIITLFLNSGMRLSELSGINIKSINKDNTLTVVGKGDKERTIYLNQACVKAIEDYLMVRPYEGIDTDALFLSIRNNRMSNRAIQHMIRKHIVASGLDPNKYTVHKLRHTAATLMYQYGDADILSLQHILGHESVTTTQIYTHVKDKQLKDTVNNNPLGKIQQDKIEKR